MISIRWLVVVASPPAADGMPSGATAHAHPPGPGFPGARPVGVHGDRRARLVPRPASYRRVGGRVCAGSCETGGMIFDGYVHQLPDTDPGETQEWLDSLDAVIDVHGKTRARYLLSTLLDRARESQVSFPATVSHAVHQHDPPRVRAVVPRRRVHRAADPRLRPLERGDDGRQGEQGRRRHRRPPLDVRLVGVAVRDRLQPLLPRQGRRHPRRPDLLPGSRRPRHLRPGVPRGPPGGRRPRPLPPGDRPHRPRPVELSAPAADARLLGVPDREHGPRPDHRPLPGPLQPLPARPPARRHQPEPGVVRSSATASATSPRRSAPSAWPAASTSTTWSSSSTATCSASTARYAATARSSRSSRRCSAAPAGTSSR